MIFTEAKCKSLENLRYKKKQKFESLPIRLLRRQFTACRSNIDDFYCMRKEVEIYFTFYANNSYALEDKLRELAIPRPVEEEELEL